MKKIIGLLFLGLFSLNASAGQIYTTYTGSQNGVTVRDADTLVQSFAFSLGFAVDNISAGSNNDMFLTSGGSIYHYSDAGEQLNSFTWGNPRLSYDGIAVSGEDFFTAYSGSQNGVTVRNSNNLGQGNFFDPGFATDNIAAGNGNEMYLTSGNSIYRYDDNGVQLAQMAFPDPLIKYKRTKHRLITKPFLEQYQSILNANGLVHLKTDSEFLHGYLLGLLHEGPHEILFAQHDIYKSSSPPEEATAIQTFYEKQYLEHKKAITYVKFRTKY